MKRRVKVALVAAGATAMLAVGAGNAFAAGLPHYGDNYESSSSGGCQADEYLSNFSGFDHQRFTVTHATGGGAECHVWLIKNGALEYDWYGTTSGYTSSWAGDGPSDKDYVCVQLLNAALGTAEDSANCFTPY
jgi:hypothetical protein